MIKKYFRALFIIFNAMMFVLPVATSIMAIMSIIDPNEAHVKFLNSTTNGKPILVGYSGGSQECINTECDNSENNEAYNYFIWPDSLSTETYYSVVKMHSGNIETKPYSQDAYMWFGFMILMLAYGSYMNIRLIKRITSQGNIRETREVT